VLWEGEVLGRGPWSKKIVLWHVLSEVGTLAIFCCKLSLESTTEAI